MQHDPHDVGLIETQLDEVVAAAERAELLEGPRRIVLTNHVEDLQLAESFVELPARLRELYAANTAADRVDCNVVRRETTRHAALDTRAQRLQRVRQVVRVDRRTHGS